MRVIVQGEENGIKKEITYDLYDEYDAIEKISSMARTTGFTATAAANMVLNDVFSQKGVFPPELIGKKPECYTYIIDYLKKRNIHYIKTEKLL